MGTRAATFTEKIRNLKDHHSRVLHGSVPAPSAGDIVNTLKYFNQTLLGVLKDIPEQSLDLLRQRNQDQYRLALFPSLDYGSLHQTLVSLVDIIPVVLSGSHDKTPGSLVLGQALLTTLSCLMVFLEREIVDTLPYLVASLLTTAPTALHQQIIYTLCYHVLPFTIVATEDDNEETYASASIPAIMMLVFQYTDNSCYHCQLVECLMALRAGIIHDLLTVIAHGTPTSRPPAAHLLFHYYPTLNPTLLDRRGVHIRFSDISTVLKAMFIKSAQNSKSDSLTQNANSDSGDTKNPKGWKPILCQLEDCNGDGTADAMKMCLNNAVCLGAVPDAPPPLYICLECAEEFRREFPLVEFTDLLTPLTQVAANCENKNCRSNEKNAVATCFSMECASYNANRPIRYCQQCNSIRHNNRRGMDHMHHTAVGSPWTLEPQLQSFLIEAVVSLLNEAQPLADKNKNKEQDRLNKTGLLDDIEPCEINVEERRTLSRYGVWLVIGLCAPDNDTPPEMMGRVLAALCNWFSSTQYLTDDPQGPSSERLKTEKENIHSWLQDVWKTHFDVFVSCLLPHPPEYARVGGHWDTLATRSDHVIEGFNRLFCLVPYELVTLDVWERVMPQWMEAIYTDIPEDELGDLKVTLSKLLDAELSPLGFEVSKIYRFIMERFANTSAGTVKQTLLWLQMLTSLSIVLPIQILLTMLQDGVESLLPHPRMSSRKSSEVDAKNIIIFEPVVETNSGNSSPLSDDRQQEAQDVTSVELEMELTCFVLMVDILLKQIEIQEIEKHQGITGSTSVPVLCLIRDMLASACLEPHTCDGEKECAACELTVTFYQLWMACLAYLCPKMALQNNRVADMLPPEVEQTSQVETPDSVIPEIVTGSLSSIPLVGGGFFVGGTEVLPSALNAQQQILTAQVEEVSEMDVAAHMPLERVVRAVAREVTLTEEDVAHATADIAHPSVIGEDDILIDLTSQAGDERQDSFWVTTQGKFKFRISELPAHLQIIHTLFSRLESVEDGDVMYHTCECLKLLILHGEALMKAAGENRGFLIWCQENQSIATMWSLIEAEWSHVAEVCVSLLLHFITLPCGSDIFWKLCESHFNHPDWKIRFQAVEKVTVIGRFLGLSSVRQCPGLQAAIAHAFCFLIASLDDINVAVSQRASLYLTSLPGSSLKALCWCLEQQFDSMILDRPMILQALHQLNSRLPEKHILSWEFFFNRFDALYVEAQIALEKKGLIAFPRDLKNSDMTSEVLARKLSRAQGALSLLTSSASVHTLTGSLATKWPYKRTMSAPANMLNRVDLRDTDFRIGEDTMVHQLQRSMDLEDTDKDTLHLLVFLFMQFLAQPLHTGSSEDKGSAKMMNLVLRHVSVLMGFNPLERSFAIVPSRIRCSPVFSAFLSNLQQVLDQNFKMGTLLLPMCLPVLQFCPAPHRGVDLYQPSFSLWYLQPHTRRCWLNSVLTVLYKYDYSNIPLSKQVIALVTIVINTLENNFHQCHKVDDPVCFPSSAYSREYSQASLAGGDADHPGDSAPQTPGIAFPGHVVGRGALTPTVVERSIPSVSVVLNGAEKESVYNGNIETRIHETADSPVHSFQDEMGECEMLDKQEFSIDDETGTPHYAMTSVGKNSGGTYAVTSVMASQIQAFDESFTVRITNPVITCESDLVRKGLVAKMQNNSIGKELTAKERSAMDLSENVASPSSPLSLMDVISVGPPVELNGRQFGLVDQDSTCSELELPTPERLLPIGVERTCHAKKSVEEPTTVLLERVWNSFGNWSPSVVEEDQKCQLIEVVTDWQPTVAKEGVEVIATSNLEKTQKAVETEKERKEVKQCALNEKSDEPFDWMSLEDSSANVIPPAPTFSIKQASLRVGEDCMVDRCMECGEILEEFSNGDLGLSVIILATFIHRQPDLAAPLLPRMLKAVAKVAGTEVFSWQHDSLIFLPGSATSVGRQFLRCVLHQLAPNQIFVQIFQTHLEENQRTELFKILSQALSDFAELNSSAPIQLLLENLNGRKFLPLDVLPHILTNVASYMECLSQEGGNAGSGGLSGTLAPLYEAFLRKVVLCLVSVGDLNPLLHVVVLLFKIPGMASYKSILDPISKVVIHAIQNCVLEKDVLAELCHLGNRVFARERDRLVLPRLMVYELVQAIRFKSSIPDTNLVLLLQLVIQDIGGSLGSNPTIMSQMKSTADIPAFQNTCAAECMRAHINDALEFISDVHALSKVKCNCRSGSGYNDDTLGGLVKAALSQYVSLELTRGTSRDSRSLAKYLPWLNSAPSALQQGPKEFMDCMSHIRLLSWLLLGSLTHVSLVGNTTSVVCQPIPADSSCHIADHVQVILAGFAEQSKTSVLHMSSLFHTFIMCQLWTVYLEQHSGSPGTETQISVSSTLMDFWAKITPGILQLVSHSKMLGEMVNLHLLSLMEALQECQSTMLVKLLPLWSPILHTYQTKLQGQLLMRLEACQNASPPCDTQDPSTPHPRLLQWLHRLQFKMAQTEFQSSAATSFFVV